MAERPPTNVISLTERRGQYDGLTCSCGCTWFRLERLGADRAGAVCLTRDGRVTGYVGIPTCTECGKHVFTEED
ncbi:hypothetical protein [Nocardiopsis synnemataformans]|uniref:hypothetical protein n=1 Tax=Nocardiopsis synnemataformans TaxID=61305 RepID=UPI003EBD813B